MISLPSYWVTSALSCPQLRSQTSCVRDKTSPLCSVWIPNPQSECSKMVFHMTKFWSHFYEVLITRAIKHLLNNLWYIHRMKHYAAAKSLQSCQTLCDPMDSSPPGSCVHGILQARTLEWVAISFSNACMHAKSLQPCQTLCDPMDSSPPGSSVHGILQARTLEWVAISFSHEALYCC